MRRRDFLVAGGVIGAGGVVGGALTPGGQELVSDVYDGLTGTSSDRIRFENSLNDAMYWAAFDGPEAFGDVERYTTDDARVFVSSVYDAADTVGDDALLYLRADQATSAEGVGAALSLYTFDVEDGANHAADAWLFDGAYGELVQNIDWDAAVAHEDHRGILPFDPNWV